MAPVGDWTAATLCTEADVVAIYDRATHLLHAGQAIDDFIALAKAEIGTQLDADLKAQREEIPKSAAADLKDNIANAAVFRDAAVNYTLYLLFAKNVTEEGAYHEAQRNFYLGEYQRCYRRAFHLMEFDVDNSGVIDDDEAAGGPSPYRFYRT